MTFPDTRFAARGKPWENVINTLIDWCAISNSGEAKNDLGDATGLIIRNYDLKNHLNFCGITDDEIKALLTFKSFEKKFKTPENIEKFLVFNPSEKIILTIRIAGSEHYDQLNGEVYHSVDDVILLSLLLKDELKNSGVIVTGLVVYLGENTHRQTCCIDCHNFIVSSKIFNSAPDFDNFWKSFVNQNVFKILTSRLKERQKNDKTILFESVASKLLGYLAHFQFEILSKTALPVLEVGLLLNKYQMEIAYSDDKRILLSGNYGVGKTVVALKKLELLYKGLKEEEVIYYVDFGEKSLLFLVFMEANKIKEKVKVIRGNKSLSNIVNSNILPDEEKNNTKNIHLIVNKYDLQDLSKKESENLYQIFQSKEQFRHSTILIVAQPILISRTDYYTTYGKKSEYSQVVHGKLKKIMKFVQLRHVMRTTKEINNLIELTQSYLNNKTIQYEDKEKSYDEIRKKKVPEKLLPKLEHESSRTSNIIEKKLKLSNQNLSPESNYSSNAVSEFLPASPKHTIDYQKPIDYDELYKLTSTSSERKIGNLVKVVTKYRYTCESEIGHNICGRLPQLIKLQKSSDPCEEILLIAFLLLEIIGIKSKRIAIIHFEKHEPLWFQLLFKVTNIFSGVTVTNNVGNFIKNPGNALLVTNYNYVRGLEFSEVLLILDAHEHHLIHFIPEAMARCMSNLAILVRSRRKGNPKSDTVKDLVDYWEVSNEIRHFLLLEILSLKVCSSHAFKNHENYKETHCQTEKSKYTSYKMHKKCKRYSDLSKTIQFSYGNLCLEEKKVSEEAEAM